MLFVCLLNIFTQYKHLVLFFSSAKMHWKIEGSLSTYRYFDLLSVRHILVTDLGATARISISIDF